MCKYCYNCMSAIEDNEPICHICGKETSVEAPAHHLLPGTILNGRYQVGKALGQGGFGITYIGRDLTLDMRVAVKEYYPNGFVNRNNTASPQIEESISKAGMAVFGDGRKKFLQEARILARFSGDPGIVDVRDFFEENNTAYIIMEYLDGEDLDEYLETKGVLTGEETVELLMPLMKALKKVHSQNHIHRDISPDNIKLMDDTVKLMDFGAARYVDSKKYTIALKEGFAPIEQYRSYEKQGPWTDIYALCATMYKCVTGKIPDNALERKAKDKVKSPSELGFEIPSYIENAIMCGMSVKKEDRYQNIDELIEGLQEITIDKCTEDTGGTEKALFADIEDFDLKMELFDSLFGNSSKKNYAPVEDVSSVTHPEQKKQSGLHHINKEKLFKKRGKKIVAVSVIAVVAIAAVIFLLDFIDIPKNRIDPTVEGFYMEQNEGVEWREPEKKLKPDEIYSSIEYNERMFYGSYTLLPDDSHNDELTDFMDSVDYGDSVYTEDGSYLSAVPCKIVAGPENMAYEEISKIQDEYNWMKLTYASENSDLHNVYAAYEVKDNKLIVTPVVSYEVGEFMNSLKLASESVEYDFEFSGPNLTISYKQDKVSLIADGFKKEVVDNSYYDYYHLYFEKGIAQDSPAIGNIKGIHIRFDDDNNRIVLYDEEGQWLADSVGKLTYDGLFTFSHSDGHTKNTEYFVYQFVYFYCGDDGIVLTDGKDIYYYQEESISNILTHGYSTGWSDLVEIAAGQMYTVGLKSDGTVIATDYSGALDKGQFNLDDWTDITSVSTNYLHTVGLKKDRTVVAVGDNKYSQCDISDWSDIVSVSAGVLHTVGLKSDNTVVATGCDDYGQCNVKNWTDIVAIYAENGHTVGLKSDGTVVAVGRNDAGQCNVEDWTDVVAISAGKSHTVGLKSDGTVVAAGDNEYDQCNVEDWTDIVRISAGDGHTVGLKSDGTVVAVGSDSSGECNVSDWTDIVAISAGGSHTVGLKSDETVVAVGENRYGQCNMGA